VKHSSCTKIFHVRYFLFLSWMLFTKVCYYWIIPTEVGEWAGVAEHSAWGTTWTSGESGFNSQWGRNSSFHDTSHICFIPTKPLQNGHRTTFRRGYNGRRVKVITNLHLASRLTIRGSTPPIPHTSWFSPSLCTWTTSLLTTALDGFTLGSF
jgi:hypothetical protein